MLRNLVLLIAVTALISIGLGLLFERVYPFVLASETARTSIVVTPEQTLELKAAARASDDPQSDPNSQAHPSPILIGMFS